MTFKEFKFQRPMTHEGFTLVEVAVSSIIFAITSVGILLLLSFSRPANSIAYQEIQAAYYGQNILENLRTKVDQRPLAGDPLSIGSHNLPLVTYSGVTYNAVYTVSADTTIGPINPKKVDLTITW